MKKIVFFLLIGLSFAFQVKAQDAPNQLKLAPMVFDVAVDYGADTNTVLSLITPKIYGDENAKEVQAHFKYKKYLDCVGSPINGVDTIKINLGYFSRKGSIQAEVSGKEADSLLKVNGYRSITTREFVYLVAQYNKSLPKRTNLVVLGTKIRGNIFSIFSYSAFIGQERGKYVPFGYEYSNKTIRNIDSPESTNDYNWFPIVKIN
jgi:hypothetical protein